MVGALTGPATLVANAVNAYTTAGIDLAADTTYFVLVDSSSTAVNRVQNTASDNEDSGGQSGWSIADGSVYRNRDNTGGWTAFGDSKKIAIKGYAKAQPPLVSNTGQSNSGAVGIGSDEYAQAFGTGSHTAGYDFDSIVLSLGQAPSGTGTLTVTVRADASGDPSGTALHTLTNPDPFVADDLNTFPAPAGATLDANTTYWVVASYSSDSGGPNWWRVLLSNGIDSGGAAGWTIDSPYKFDSRTALDGWQVGSTSRGLKLQVKGTAKGGPTLSTDATLSALALSGVTLDPTFVSSTETYTATVVNAVTETTVTATPTHSGATVAFKDGADNALTNPVTLAVGANVIKVEVTAEDTTTTKTYMVTVMREAATLSTDATLSALALSGVTLAPTFVSSTEDYTATVGNSVTETTVTATPTDSGATVAFKDGDNNTLTSPVSLAVGANVIKAEVTAEDTTTTKTYMVTVTREAAAGTCLAPTFTGRAEVWRGTITVGNDAFSRGYEDNRFGDLSDPDNFGYGGTNYTIAGIRESFDTGSVNRLELDLDAFLPGSDQDKLRLHLCGDTFDLTTATQAGTSTYRWTDAVLDWSGATTIEAALSGSPPAIVTDGVQVTSTPDTPDTYGLGETIEITVTFDTAVTVDTTGGTPRIRFVLNGGVNPVRVWAEYSSGSGGTALVFTYVVQAGDLDDDGIWLPADFLELQGGTIRDAAYPTVAATLTYAQPGTQSEHKVDGGPTLSTDATLSALALSGVTLDPTFVSATEDYTATVGNAVTETTVTATPTHSGATVAFKDGADNALTNPVTLAEGANVIKAVVTAEDTTTTKTYMVTVTREATTTAPAIVTGGVQVTSTPMATADTYGLGETIAITVTFDNAVTVDTSDGTPRIQFRLGPPRDDKWAEYSRGSGGTALVFTYMVQAGDRDVVDGIWLPENELQLQSGTISAAADNTVDATLTYTQPGPQSGHKVDGSLTTTDATLSALALTGVTLAPTFVSSTETYTATAGNAVMETTVTATPTHPGATVALKDGADNALTNPVTLAVGANVIKAVVTAEDGTTTKTYMVTVTRGATTEPAIINDGVQVTSMPAAGDTYGLGETIAITVTFDNAVTVDTSGGTPRIAFHLDGGLHRWAEYRRGSGGTALVFTYTVQAGDMAAAGIRLEGNLLELQGGTIRAAADDTNTVNAILTYADTGLQTRHKVDGSSTTADATLSALELSDVTLVPTFVSSTETYTATVVNSVTETMVTASPTQSGATVAFKDRNDTVIMNPVDLAVGANVIKAVVTAPDSTTMKTYMVTVTLTPAIVTDGVQVTSTPATGDTYGRGETIEITVIFDSAVMVGGTPRIAFHLDGGLRWAEYSRGSGGTALVFTYTVLADDRAVKGILLAAGEVELFRGTIRAATDTIADATLTYADPGLQTRHKVDGSSTTADATLSALALTGVTLAPTFVSSTETYTATVGNSVTETTVTATPTHSGATVAFKDGADNALTNPVTLAVGANVIKAVVTAEDTTTMKTYMVTVTRAATAPAIVTGGVRATSMPLVGDTYGLGETIAITVTFDKAVTVDTSGGKPRIRSVLNGGGTPVDGWAEYSRGSGGTALVFTYTVQAGDMDDDGIWLPANYLELQGGTISDAAYPTVAATLTYTQPGTQSEHKVDGGPTTTDDATLRALALSGVTLAPTFVSSTETYTATVGNSVTETTVTATPTHSGATVAFKDGADNALTNPVTLAVGANVIKAVVTAEDTTTMKTYMVTVTRETVDEPPTEPDAPTGLSATVSDQEVDLIWTAPASNGGATILRYEYELDGSGSWTSTGGTATSTTVTGLTNGQSYTFRVRAVNRVGAGGASSSQFATPTATLVAPDTPFGLSATPGNRQVMLSWVQPSGGAALTHYEYELDFSGTWISTGGTAPSHTVTGLNNGQSYTFRVRAVNSAGASAASGSQTATPTTTEPEAPESLSFTPGDQQVTLRWRAPTNDGGEPITHYEYEQDGSGTWISTGGTATSHTVRGLANGQTYMFRVRAVNALGNGAVVTIEATPAPSTGGGGGGGGGGLLFPPEAPAALMAMAGDGAVRLEWSPPESDGGTPILRYEHRLKELRGEFGEWTPIEDSAPDEVNATGYTVDELGNGTVYVFEVRAVNLVGNGRESEAVEVVMGLDRAYGSNFLAEDLQGGEAGLEWAPFGGTPRSLKLRFGAGLRFEEDELDGEGEVTATRMGSYGYRYTSQTTGELRLDYDGEESCELRLTFRGEGAGSYSYRCGGALQGQGSFRLTGLNRVPEITGAGLFEVVENQAMVGRLEAVDPDEGDGIAGYGIAGGADGALFEVVEETGELLFREVPDYETPSDVESAEPVSGAADNEYIVVVEVRSGEGERERKGSRAIRVRVADEEEPPEITSVGPFEVVENRTRVGQLEAVDQDKQDEITEYGIAGGADGGLFEVVEETGELMFREAPDYETPGDEESAEPASGAADNEYIVVVEVRSGEGERERKGSRAIRVRVSDEEEPPEAPAAPVVTAEGSDSLKVSWTEPENRGPEITDYEVRYRESGEAGYSDGGHEGTGLEVRLSGLEEGTVYEVQVRAVNEEGMSEWSEPGEGRTDMEEPDPDDPSDFTGEDLEGRRLTLRLEGEEGTAGSLELRFGEGNRFEQIESEAGTPSEASPSRSGAYTYEKTGPHMGTVSLTYDDGASCEIRLSFTGTGVGGFVYDCGGGSPAEGSFRLTTGSLFVPVILSSAGQNQSFFTSELTLTNRGDQDVKLDYSYSANRGEGSGAASDVLPAGRQRVETDALTYLRGLGIPIPEEGNRIGTLWVEVRLGSEVEAVVRTTTVVPDGRAGLAYLGVAEEEGFEEAVYLCGLRQNGQDRSNVAFQNMGAPEEGAITVRTTVYSGEAADATARVLKDVTLEPGGFHQYSGLLGVLGVPAQGYVKVERVEGRASFYAYGVINDQANSDGSFVFPVTANSLEGKMGQTLPVIVETSAFTSELMVTNFSEEPRRLDFQFVAEGIEADDKTVGFSMELEAGEQQIIPELVEELRREEMAGLGTTRGFYLGPLFVTAEEGDLSGIVIGARTGSEGGGGQYSVFYNAVPEGEAFTKEAWVEGLQQNEENRSNLALVNTGEVDGSPSVFHLEIYDGETGLLAETVVTKPIPARGWHQINGILGSYAPETRQGYIRIEKVSGENPFLAYGVVNDGGAPGERSGDGAYLPAQE